MGGEPDIYYIVIYVKFAGVGFPGGSVVKNLSANAGDIRDMDLIPGLGRYPGERHGNPLQYSYLENPVDRGAWQAAVHRVRVEHN